MLVRPNRRWLLLGLVALAYSTNATADDKDQKQQCISAHADSQKLRSDSKLQEAREKLLVCSRPECPGAVRADCGKWLSEVQEEMPSVVVVATDANGNDVADVKVSADGKVVAPELTGQPVFLDPGAHDLRFERQGYSPVERKLVIRVGERNRRVEVSFTPTLAGADSSGTGDQPGTGPSSGPTEDKGTSSGGGVPTMTWILGGVGVVGLGSFGFFALNGKSKENDLEKCKPNCAHSDVQSAKTSYLIGDISLGVGVAALAGAAYFYFSAPKKAATASAPPLWLDVHPTPHGMAGVLSGHF
jgi:hypothetical protein